MGTTTLGAGLQDAATLGPHPSFLLDWDPDRWLMSQERSMGHWDPIAPPRCGDPLALLDLLESPQDDGTLIWLLQVQGEVAVLQNPSTCCALLMAGCSHGGPQESLVEVEGLTSRLGCVWG